MCKAIDRGLVIEGVRLLEKRGGKSGTWVAGDPAPSLGHARVDPGFETACRYGGTRGTQRCASRVVRRGLDVSSAGAARARKRLEPPSTRSVIQPRPPEGFSFQRWAEGGSGEENALEPP
jgi:hypothetical protein